MPDIRRAAIVSTPQGLFAVLHEVSFDAFMGQPVVKQLGNSYRPTREEPRVVLSHKSKTLRRATP